MVHAESICGRLPISDIFFYSCGRDNVFPCVHNWDLATDPSTCSAAEPFTLDINHSYTCRPILDGEHVLLTRNDEGNLPGHGSGSQEDLREL